MEPEVRRSSDEVAALLRSRRTVHWFAPEKPPKETILRALDLARWAPNHRLTEPWRFYLVGPQTADAVARLNASLVSMAHGEKAGAAKLDRWRAVPGWLVLTCRHAEDPVQAQEDYAACCCAAQNMMLYLWSEGIGAKWTTGAVTRTLAFYDLLGIDAERERVVGLFWYGYPARIPETRRKPLADVLTERP